MKPVPALDVRFESLEIIRPDLEVRVPGDQAEQLTARISTGPRDGDSDSHTNLRMTMQRTVTTGSAERQPGYATRW